MALLSVLICLLVERFLSSLHTIRQFDWFDRIVLGVAKSGKRGSLVIQQALLVLFILLTAVLVSLVGAQLGYLFKPLEFVFSTAVLFFCLGPETFYDRLKAFCEAEQMGDEASASWYARKILRRPLTQEEKQVLPQTLLKALFPLVNDRLFAPMFWFCILGPYGAVLYRLVSRLASLYQSLSASPNRLKRNAERLFACLAWLPARLAALGFMLVGDFSAAIRYCRSLDLHLIFSLQAKASHHLLICVGSGAVNLPKDPNEIAPRHLADAMALIRRSVELGLGGLALFTLAGVL